MLQAQHEEIVGEILGIFQEICRCPGPQPGQKILPCLSGSILAHERMKLVAVERDLIAILILGSYLNSIQE